MLALAPFLLICAAVLAFPVLATAQSTPLAFEVESTKGWQATALIVRKGQALSLSAESVWSVDYRNFSFVGPEGYSPSEDGRIYQGCKLDSTIPYGMLLVKVGDNPNFELVGRGGEFVASYDGPVSFRIHDGDACLGDNAGSVKVTVTAAESLPVAQGAPFFVCLSGPRSACQGAYSHPVQDPASCSPPAWLTSPQAVKCLASIADATPIGILIPKVGPVSFTGIEEIEFFETFYTRAIERGIPVTWERLIPFAPGTRDVVTGGP